MINNKTSILVPSQLPSFVRENPDYSNFTLFVQSYYEWLAESGNVEDAYKNILNYVDIDETLTKFESYFFNEVKRIKQTIEKINDGRNWLVLIDELFKGTNIQDAMKCSTAVIRGLINIKNCLFILSTHLYEIGDELKDLTSIEFKYFETISWG